MPGTPGFHISGSIVVPRWCDDSLYSAPCRQTWCEHDAALQACFDSCWTLGCGLYIDLRGDR